MSQEPGYVDNETKTIVLGFIHEIQEHLTLSHGNNTYYQIPPAIINICLSYYIMSTKGSFQFKINKLLLISMSNAKFQSRFKSKPIDIINKFKWIMSFYPNGAFTSTKTGCLNLVHQLTDTDPNWEEIILFVKWEFKELHITGNQLWKFNELNKFSVGGVKNLFRFSKAKYLNELTINIEFKILQIIDKNSKILLRYGLKQFKSNRMNLEWKIDKDLLHKMQTLFCSFESQIYYEMWCIKFCPRDRFGSFYISLCLCGLPTMISKIEANCSINVYDENGIVELDSIIHEFDYGYNLKTNWMRRILSFKEQFRHFKSCTICIYIKILRMYDLDGNEIKQ